jgi:hypothetical protein
MSSVAKITTLPESLSWRRLPRESATAYVMFKAYRGTDSFEDEDQEFTRNGKSKDIGARLRVETWEPKEPIREIPKLHKIFQNVTLYTLYKYSSNWKWKDRARQYDLYVYERYARDNRDADIRRMRLFDAARAREAERVLAQVELIRAKVALMADQAPLWEVQADPQVVETYPDGRPKTVIHQHFHPAKWRMRDITLMFKHTEKSMEYLFDLVYGKGGRPVDRPTDEDVLTEEQIDSYFKFMKSELDAGRVGGPKGIGHDERT